MEWISENLGISSSNQAKIAASIAVVAITLLVRYLVIRYIQSRLEDEEDVDGIYRARKIASYATTFVILVSLAFIWIDAFDELATYLGLLSAGIAIALADLLKNMAGWAYILTRRPLNVGDRVEVDGTVGDVVDVRLFRFSLMEVGHWVDAEQSTGRLVHVPNGLLFSQKLSNYTEGFAHVWEDLPVLITFESDYEHAERIIRRILAEKAPDVEATVGANIRETARRYQIRVGTLTPTVYLSVRDSGVLLSARYLVDARSRRGTSQTIWRSILEAFREADDIDLAYPTYRVVNGAGPSPPEGA